MTTHLVIGDVHAKPGASTEHLSILGHFALKHRPDVILFLGDFADMPSLCSYDKGTRGFVGRSYKDDVEAAQKALAAFKSPLNKYNNTRSKQKKKQYTPKLVMLGGNHDEARIERALDAEPILEGSVSLSHLGYEAAGFEYYNYLDIVNLDGVRYTHCVKHFNSPNMVGGLHHAYQLIQKRHASFTVGHSHILDYKTTVIEGGGRIHGLSAGCFFTHDEGYAKQNNDAWWRGVVMKYGVKDGDYSPWFISLVELEKHV